MGWATQLSDVLFRNIFLTHNFCIIIIIIDLVQPADLCVIIITICWPSAELCIIHPCCNLACSLFPSRQTLEDGRPTSPYWLYQCPPSIFLIILPGCRVNDIDFPYMYQRSRIVRRFKANFHSWPTEGPHLTGLTYFP